MILFYFGFQIIRFSVYVILNLPSDLVFGPALFRYFLF